MKHLKSITKNIIFLSFLTTNLWAIDPSSDCFSIGEPFMRNHEGTYQIACKTYRHPSGTRVTLLGASHIAVSTFYDAHNEFLSRATQVLFEGKGLDKNGREFHASDLGQMNDLLTNHHLRVAKAFGLEYQFNYLDYNRESFTLADYSFQEVAEMEGFKDVSAMLEKIKLNIEEVQNKYAEKSENPINYFFNQQVANLVELGYENYSAKMQAFLFMTEDQLREAIDDQTWFENEFTKRNLIVLSKLATCLSSISSPAAHIVISYGAAHMPCFEKNIHKVHGFMPESQEWNTVLPF